MNVIRSNVPCNGCTACCRGDLIVLHPEHGDDVSSYETEAATHPISGKAAIALKHKPDNSCVYLGLDGCTIHERAPVVCREFDCRKLYQSMTRAQRRELVATGFVSRQVLEAGRVRSKDAA